MGGFRQHQEQNKSQRGGGIQGQKSQHEYAITTNNMEQKKPDNGIRGLLFDQTYPCPACGSGELSAITLMDVFACDFCRHLFTANLSTQSVQLADSLPSMAWHWRSGRWRAAYRGETAGTSPLIWSFCSGLTIVPVGLIALSNYIFPPLEDSSFPLIWIGLTLLSHSVMSIWLLAEYHRWPWYVASRIRFQRFQRAMTER